MSLSTATWELNTITLQVASITVYLWKTFALTMNLLATRFYLYNAMRLSRQSKEAY